MSKPLEHILDVHRQMYRWAKELYPICRSLTGDGTRQTLRYLQDLIEGLEIHEVPSGTRAFDWQVPDEWNIREGWIKNEHGETVLDFKVHNLHVMGYSEPVDRVIGLNELQRHLHSLEDKPDAIPYITSYYERRWGFCMAHRERERLEEGNYHVYIDSTLEPGSLSYGELILPGDTEEEVLLSTYVCHPSMANNELSGPVVTAALVRWLQSLPRRRYTYRVLFIPETIGSIVYLSRHLETMKQRTRAGFVISCVGDERTYSYVPSRKGDTLADRAALHVLDHHAKHYEKYTFFERGGDERQYCSVGVDLPVALMMRSKFHVYPEYHTSLDDMDLISAEGLGGALEAHRQCLYILEHNRLWRAAMPCEPQLGKRGLYPTLSTPDGARKLKDIKRMRNILAMADGTLDLIALAETMGTYALECIPLIERLVKEGLLVEV